jgi:hypothetical protein
MEAWIIAVICLVAFIVIVAFCAVAVKAWAQAAYDYILKNPQTQCDIDAFVGPDNPVSKVKVAIAHKLQIGARTAQTTPIALELFDSPHVPGLKVSRKAGDPPPANSGIAATTIVSLEDYLEAGNKPVVIATIRMGFGHHRVAYSAASWALKNGHPTIFHDLLNIKSGTLFFHHMLWSFLVLPNVFDRKSVYYRYNCSKQKTFFSPCIHAENKK